MRFRLVVPFALFAAGCAPAVSPGPIAPAVAYDVVISNGKIVDGTGNPWWYGDVGLRGDRIVYIGPKGSLARAQAGERVDASGMVVAPGFIDIQSHSWGALLTGARSYMYTAVWLVNFPGLAIFITMLGFNFLGNALRDTLDPKLRRE